MCWERTERKKMRREFNDCMVRATAADGMIRAFAASTGGLVEEARNIHRTAPVVTAALGRLLTAGAIMGAMTLKNSEDRKTLKIDGDGPMRGLLVTVDADGGVKGYPYESDVILPPNAKGKLDVGSAVGHGVLSVIADVGLKEPYVGQVELQSGEIAEDIAWYYANSEQIPSSVGLGVLVDRDHSVICAGGFVFQLMPGCPDSVALQLEDRLRGVDSVTAMLQAGLTPEDIINHVLQGMDPVVTDRTVPAYRCNCSREKTRTALLTVGEEELKSMIRDGKPIEVSCHFCSKKYSFSVAELQEMLDSATKKE